MPHHLLRRLGAIVLGTTSAFICTPAMPAGLQIAGGEIDDSYTGADLYLGTPREAPAPRTKACQAAKNYVVNINAGQFSRVVDLFTEDAVVLDPTRRVMKGRSQIQAFYDGPIRQIRPELVGVAYLGDSKDCVVELARKDTVGGQPRYVLVSIDHFTVDQHGKVVRMVAFARPPRSQ
jgi:SnoaL-like protein